jgi:integrase
MKGCRPLTDAEVQHMLSELEPRDRLLVLTGLYFGTRISETLALTFGDMETGWLHISSAKGSNNVSFQIPSLLLGDVERLRLHYVDQGITVTAQTPLFLSRKGDQQAITVIQACRVVRAAKDRCGLSGKVNTHSLRKTFVTRIYNLSGRDIAETKKYSRHKSLANLDYYIGTTQDLNLVQSLTWGQT